MGLSVGFRGLVLGNREGSLMLARDESPLKQTPLHTLHVARGARMVPFAGYEMPVQYPAGVLREHLHTRENAGLFDVSHMGQILLRPLSGRREDAARALETDVLGLPAGRQRYTLLTNPAAGVLDDLMVANEGGHLRLVVNASRKAADEAHLRDRLAADCLIEALADHALLALQGPQAENVLAALAPDIRAMRFEISVGAGAAEALWDALLRDPAVMPARRGLRPKPGGS
jgi:aminomethyltransferase